MRVGRFDQSVSAAQNLLQMTEGRGTIHIRDVMTPDDLASAKGRRGGLVGKIENEQFVLNLAQTLEEM